MNDPIALNVEDEIDLASIFETALKAAHYTTEIVTDGAFAFDKVKTLKPKLVILDLHLPNLDGAKILKQIRATDEIKSTIVIVTTADARMAETSRSDANVVLLKPISFTLLRDLAVRFHDMTPKSTAG